MSCPTDETLLREAISDKSMPVALRVSPALADLQTTFIDYINEECIFEFTTPPSAVQGNGVVSGGCQATMLDSAMALALLAQVNHQCTGATITLSVNMLSAASPGKFIAVAGIERLGRRIAFSYARLYDKNRTALVATATSTLAIREK